MRRALNDPCSNDLPSGILEKDILDAVEDSGYPLQTKVAAFLLSHDFFVAEEWSYVDADTHQTREIDIFAMRELRGTELEPLLEKSDVQPTLSLIFECKQSILPYVFFLCQGKAPWIDHFPIIAGLRNRFMWVSGLDYGSLITPIVNALGLNGPEVRHDFIMSPSYSMSFSKCVRKSNRIELSGREAYNSLVLPLIKAMQHYENAMRPKKKSVSSFGCHVTLGIGVLDAPIIGVQLSAEDSKPHILHLPWVRVARRGTMETPLLDENIGTFAIDIVHWNFLEEYLVKHLFPFFLDTSKLAMQHWEVLRKGRGQGIEDESGRIELREPSTRRKTRSVRT